MPGSLAGHIPYELHEECAEVPLPKFGAGPIGNGYWSPKGLYKDDVKKLLYVGDSSYSKVYVFNLLGTSSFITRLERKAGYLTFPVALSSRPGLEPRLSSVLSSSDNTVGDTIDYSVILRDGLNSEYSGTTLELSTINLRAVGTLKIGTENVKLEVRIEGKRSTQSTRQGDGPISSTIASRSSQLKGGGASVAQDGSSSATLPLKFTMAGTYELSVYQLFAGGELHFLNSPKAIIIAPGPTELGVAYTTYEFSTQEIIAGRGFRLLVTPRDIYRNPTLSSGQGEDFWGRIRTEEAPVTFQFTEIPSDTSTKPDKAPTTEDKDTSTMLQATVTIEEAGTFPFGMSKDGVGGTYDAVSKIDVLPGPPQLDNTFCRVNSHYLDEDIIHSLEYESTKSDATISLTVEPFDEFDNIVFEDYDFQIEVDTGAEDVLTFDLEPPTYTKILVVEKGNSASMTVTFLHDGTIISGGTAQISVKAGEELLNTSLLFITVISSVIATVLSYIFYRKCIKKADSGQLKSEATEVKENVFSIGMDFFDIAR